MSRRQTSDGSVVWLGSPRGRCDKPMRPTLKLSQWRIATDLRATRELRIAVPPAWCGRQCACCRNWTVAHSLALPQDIRHELARIGIDPACPSDLYACGEPAAVTPTVVHHRVTFHLIGRILEGPSLLLEDPTRGHVRNYIPSSSVSDGPWLSVARVQRVPSGGPSQPARRAHLLEVDFRLPVPWVLDEPFVWPPLYSAPSEAR